MSTNDHVIHLENGRLAAENPRTTIEKMAQDAVASQHVVIHFHGGLVKYSSGIEIAERLLPIYKSKNTYPLFFVWESGLIETLTNNFSEIASEKLFRILWKRIAKIAKRKFGQTDGDRAVFVLPPADTIAMEQGIDMALDEADPTFLQPTEVEIPAGLDDLGDFERRTLENELLFDAQLNFEIHKVSNELRDPATVEGELKSRSSRIQGSSATLMDPRALDRFVDRPVPGHRGLISTAKMIKAIVAIAARVISRFVKGRGHGFHATIVEEILRELYLANVGEFVWSTMKKDTADAFKPDGNVYGGTALLEALAANITADDIPKITLIGHSTGAIYISRFLDHATKVLPPNQQFRVVFLAPASTCELTAATLEAHKSRISDFRMFTMTDEYEKKDQLVKVLYPHSLLYFVSGVVEGGYDVPLVGMERYYDQNEYPTAAYPGVATVRDYVQSDPNHAVWSVNTTGSSGHRSASEKHGDFDNDQETLNSIKHFL